MELRADLTPPELDEGKVKRMAEIARRLDGASPRGPGVTLWDTDVEAFNSEMGTSLGINDFQGVYSTVSYEMWVRGIEFRRRAASCTGVTRGEMIEIVKRVVACEEGDQFYLAVFLLNCKHRSQSDLIYWPKLVAEFPRDREPTAEEIADLAMRG